MFWLCTSAGMLVHAMHVKFKAEDHGVVVLNSVVLLAVLLAAGLVWLAVFIKGVTRMTAALMISTW